MKLTSLITLPLFLALGLTLAACNSTAPTPAANAETAAVDTEKAAAEAKAADEAAAAEKAADDAKAAEAAVAKAAEDKAAVDAAAAAKAAADKAAKEKAAADAAAAAPKLPATGLKPDTLLAVRAATDRIGYVGVWAANAAACATVDQAGAAGYVVITPISVRQGDAFTLVDAAPLSAGKATLTAGETTIEIAQSAPDQLTVNGAALVRCTL